MPELRKQAFSFCLLRYICLLSLLAIPVLLVLDRRPQCTNFLTISLVVSLVVSIWNRGWEDCISSLYGIVLPLLMLAMIEENLDDHLSSANYIILIYVAGTDSQNTYGMFICNRETYYFIIFSSYRVV